TGATVADMFPSTFANVSWTATNGASGTGNINTTVDLASGASVVFTATGTISPTATGTLSNTATVTPPSGVTDPTLSDNSSTDSDTLTPQADLAIVKTDNQTAAVPGTSDTYTITVTNNGPSAVTGAT